MRHLPLILLCGCLLLSACARNSLHYRINADGTFQRVSPEMYRDEFQTGLAQLVQANLPEGWTAQVSIPQTPFYANDDDPITDNWHWENLTISVRIVGQPGLDSESIDEAAIRERIRSQTWDRRSGHLDIVTAVVVADAAEAAEAAAVDESPAVVEPTTDAAAPLAEPATPAHGSKPPAIGKRRYVVQEGDTLALISSVFYGEAAAWRRIVEANPGLDPAALSPGQEIIIP